jgi:hypothetical protein
MQRYIVERTLRPGMTEGEIEDAIRRLIAVNATIPEIRGLHSHLAVDQTRFFCEYEALDPAVLWEAARLADLPADRVTEVIEIRADMYRLSNHKEGR